jgi:hypothetical protein
MAYWNLGQIREEVRHLTGRFSENELSTTELDLHINRVLTLVLPADVKVDPEYTTYSLLLTANQPYYTQPLTTYTNFVPTATVDNKPLFFYESQPFFKDENTLNYSSFTPWTGDGSTVTFSTTFTGVPIYPGTLYLSDGVETFQDTNTTYSASNTSLVSDGAGTATINYSTGVLSVTFAVAPTSGASVIVKYIVMLTGQPQAVLQFDNQWRFYPVPDQTYKFQIQAFSSFAALVLPSDTPYLQEWGPAIATGAAREIFRKQGDNENYATMQALYSQQLSYMLTRTLVDLSSTRAQPRF